MTINTIKKLGKDKLIYHINKGRERVLWLIDSGEPIASLIYHSVSTPNPERKSYQIQEFKSLVQRQGYGTQLVLALEEIAKQEQIDEIGCSELKEGSAKLFKKLGYFVAKRIDCHLYWCTLNLEDMNDLEINVTDGKISRQRKDEMLL